MSLKEEHIKASHLLPGQSREYIESKYARQGPCPVTFCCSVGTYDLICQIRLMLSSSVLCNRWSSLFDALKKSGCGINLSPGKDASNPQTAKVRFNFEA